jgi:hypothetical protein
MGIPCRVQARRELPARNTGVNITNNGGVDFFGTALYAGMPDIGIAEEP